MSRPVILLCCLLAAASAGCGQKKIAECNALLQVINPGVEGLERAPKHEADPTGVSDVRSMADGLDKIAGEIGAVQLTLPELKKLRDDYQKMVKDLAKAEHDLAAAAQDQSAGTALSPDERKAVTDRRAAANTALDAAVAREDPLVDAINKYCQAP